MKPVKSTLAVIIAVVLCLSSAALVLAGVNGDKATSDEVETSEVSTEESSSKAEVSTEAASSEVASSEAASSEKASSEVASSEAASSEKASDSTAPVASEISSEETSQNVKNTYLYGDVDGDGQITAADAREVLRLAIKLDTLEQAAAEAAKNSGKPYTPEILAKAADVDFDRQITGNGVEVVTGTDGKVVDLVDSGITAADARLILRVCVRLEALTETSFEA